MMKKSILFLSITFLALFGTLNKAASQEQPKPKKDSVNMDTHAKPTFYYAVEDEKENPKKGNFPVIPVIAGGLVVVAAGIFLFSRKKK
jgi:hypothetical protein